MKKILLSLFLAGALLSSCGSSHDYSAINEQIANGEELTQDEYSAMLDYVSEFHKAESKILQGQDPYSSGNMQKIHELNEEYPYLDSFGLKLEAAMTADKLDSENQKRFNELTKLIEEKYESLSE